MLYWFPFVNVRELPVTLGAREICYSPRRSDRRPRHALRETDEKELQLEFVCLWSAAGARDFKRSRGAATDNRD